MRKCDGAGGGEGERCGSLVVARLGMARRPRGTGRTRMTSTQDSENAKDQVPELGERKTPGPGTRGRRKTRSRDSKDA